MKQFQKRKRAHRNVKSRVGFKLVARTAVLSAAGALGANSTVAQVTATPIADTSGAQSLTPGNASQNAGATRHFDIASGDLASTLESFGRATGIKVQMTIPGDKIGTFRSRGTQGDFSPEQALRQILAETGLEARFKTSTEVEILVRNTERVEVTASMADISMQQFQQPLLDTAQTVQVVPQFILSEQADTSLRDSLRNVPGISIAAGEGGSQGDSLTIRGFNARNDIFLDGIRDFGSYYRDSFNYSAVDVLEGPASVEFGRGSTGGVVNQQSKQPETKPSTALAAQFGTDEMRRGTLDLNQPIKAIPGGTAFRLNAVGEETDVAGRNVTTTHRFGVAPSISFGLDARSHATLSYMHEGENDIPDYGLPYFGATYAAVPTDTYYGIASANRLGTTPDVLTARMDRDLGVHATLRNTFRWANYPRTFRITEPQINSAATALYSNADGKTTYEGPGTAIAVRCAIVATPSASCFPFNTPLSQVMVKRNEISGR